MWARRDDDGVLRQFWPERTTYLEDAHDGAVGLTQRRLRWSGSIRKTSKNGWQKKYFRSLTMATTRVSREHGSATKTPGAWSTTTTTPHTAGKTTTKGEHLRWLPFRVATLGGEDREEGENIVPPVSKPSGICC